MLIFYICIFLKENLYDKENKGIKKIVYFRFDPNNVLPQFS